MKKIDCPLGGDIENNCADCIHSGEYHFVNGDCVKREFKYFEVDEYTLTRLIMVAPFNEKINFATDIMIIEQYEPREIVDAEYSSWHGITKIKIFDEENLGVVAIGYYGGGYTVTHDTSSTDYDDGETINELKKFIKDYLDAIESKIVYLQLEVDENGKTMMDEII